MKKLIFTILTLLTFSKVCGQQPSWLSVLPQSKEYLYAVGASSPYFYPETTKAKAIEDAIFELARTIEVGVKVKQINWFEDTGSLFSGLSHFEEEYEEEIDTTLFNLIKSNYELVSQWHDPKSKILYVLLRIPVKAISTDTVYSIPDEFVYDPALAGLSVSSRKQPKWIYKIPVSDVAIYAVGASDRYFDPAETRKRAIQNARSELSRIINLKIQTLLDNWSEGNKAFELSYSRRISRTISNAKLTGSQIVGFWIDPKTGANYALARMYKKNLIYQIKQVAINAIKQNPPEKLTNQDKPIEEILNEALNQLDKELEKLNKSKGELK
ncbi:LPP20 family lipoprotein [Candidatus Kryptobacter tengchongensis]|uniref:LPP20 family lipoprotein n=1 Tax=Kryptobacter tengchongensis TaxID=1643429 RepID=UPI0007084D1A|nr:LPP20 family lipoprotein [Candidatus Kryptobacter tengchongensis]CUS85665.1 LPP20 lipoprotein [Candidatus Kryptobacter tengchongensis]